MTTVRCPQGHQFDSSRHGCCPVCGKDAATVPVLPVSDSEDERFARVSAKVSEDIAKTRRQSKGEARSGQEQPKGDLSPMTQRDELVERLVGITQEQEATEAEKKEVVKVFTDKLAELKVNAYMVAAQIRALDHPVPLPLFDRTAEAAKAMENLEGG